MAGTRFGDFELVQTLGGGGMGLVYLARQVSLDRYVALKVPRPQFLEDERLRQRFLREARNAARLNNPHVIQVYTAGEEAGTVYLAMEYVRGESLRQRLERGPLPVEEAVRIGSEVCEALTAAHESADPNTGARGMIHRDVKPENIFLEEQTGAVKLGDFGLSRAASDATMTTHALGTPAYASPEQCLGGQVDHRTDLYSLGLVLYEMLTGRCLSAAPTPEAVPVPYAVVQHASGGLPPAPHTLNPQVPEALSHVVLRAIAYRPEQRFGSAAELAQALRASLAAPQPGAPTPVAPSPQTYSPAPVASPMATPPPATVLMETPRRRRTSPAVWIVPVVVLAIAAGSVVALLAKHKDTNSGGGHEASQEVSSEETGPSGETAGGEEAAGGGGQTTGGEETGGRTEGGEARGEPEEIVALTAEAPPGTTLRGRYDYQPSNAVDRDSQGSPVTDTAWNAKKGLGHPQLTIWMAARYEITRVDIIPGFAKYRNDQHGDRWIKNNRIRTLTLMFPDGTQQTVDLPDSSAWRYYTIELAPPRNVDHFTLRVEDVYRADRQYWRVYGDTAISDVRVWGYR